MSSLYTKEEALAYHSSPRPGKVEVVLTKPFATQKDLSMAYSPGVAEACMEIHRDPALAGVYTGRSNLVAVVSNGTAVLGLGDIGAVAGKPVMEGKGVLFKFFADVDVFDLEVGETDPDKLCEVVKALEPTFGGINLEDIKAPECFYIEEKLKKEMKIPVFHDDQHGTAVISGAALLNACEISGRKPEDMRVVVMGAGAAGIACAKFYCLLGVKRENVFMFDSRGLIHQGRGDLNPYKAEFAQPANAGDLAACMKGAHLFLGLSKGNLVTKDMVRSMADHPVIFAMANPVPEISYEDAKAARPECIMGTGRSDYPNQINNVSGFPYIFRGALDVEATEINDEMKIAAAKALAALAREPVPAGILKAYGVNSLSYGVDYVIPKPLDERILTAVTPAVARAAMDSGVARRPIADMAAYTKGLEARVKASHGRILPFIDSYRK
ncbi:MAG: malate dehydrogenase [Desulfovibrionaceae bacterium]|nr:malate dehydrogenase [Desulfovibrionaceae bacterium]